MKSNKFLSTTLIEYLNEKNDTLLAPNGSPSNLTPELYKMVRTVEFKEWFGDWENDKNESSKIIDENGEPMLVYHGTNVKFDKFELDKQKIGWSGKGFYFSKDKKAVTEYGKFVFEMFLNIRNPFEVIGNSPNDIYYELKQKYNTPIETDVSVILKEKGYDGVIFNHWDKGNMITCFNSKQIKIVSN